MKTHEGKWEVLKAAYYFPNFQVKKYLEILWYNRESMNIGSL